MAVQKLVSHKTYEYEGKVYYLNGYGKSFKTKKDFVLISDPNFEGIDDPILIVDKEEFKNNANLVKIKKQ